MLLIKSLRCNTCRVKDKVRRLARHHKVFLSDVTKLNDNLERAKVEARHALEAKKRMLQQALDRRFEEAMEAVDDEIQVRSCPQIVFQSLRTLENKTAKDDEIQVRACPQSSFSSLTHP